MSGTRWRRLRVVLCLTLLGVALTACTTTYDVRREPIAEYPAIPQIDLTVGLVLSEELRTTKWQDDAMGQLFVLPVGEALPGNCEAVARALFARVAVAAQRQALATAVDALLIPRVMAVERTKPAPAMKGTRDMTSLLTIILEWRLEDSGGSLIWVKTVSGTGKRAQSLRHKQDATAQTSEAVANLFTESFRALSSSPQIKAYAATRRSLAQ